MRKLNKENVQKKVHMARGTKKGDRGRGREREREASLVPKSFSPLCILASIVN